MVSLAANGKGEISVRRSVTLTEAQARSGLLVVLLDRGGTHSNFRQVPYAEEYRAATSVIESPVERIQQAAQDEEERKQKS